MCDTWIEVDGKESCRFRASGQAFESPKVAHVGRGGLGRAWRRRRGGWEGTKGGVFVCFERV